MYGTLLNSSLAQHLTGNNANYAGIARLAEYRIDVTRHGYLTARPGDEEDFIWGRLWRVNKEGLAAFDKFECVDKSMYQRIACVAYGPSGKSHGAFVYVANELPLEDYHANNDTIALGLKGAIEANLPSEYISTLIHVMSGKR